MTAADVRTPTRRTAASRRAAGVALALISGVAVAVQSRINGELGLRLGDGVAAATVSFGLGLLVLLVLARATGAGRRALNALRAALRDGSLRWWQCLGGVCRAFLVASQGLTVHALGVAVSTVAVVGSPGSASHGSRRSTGGSRWPRGAP